MEKFKQIVTWVPPIMDCQLDDESDTKKPDHIK